MAAFSYQYQPFLLDSVFLPNKIPGFLDEPNLNTNSCFSQFYPQEPVNHFSFENNEFSESKKQSSESSTLVDQSDSGDAPAIDQVKVTSQYNKKRKSRNNSSASSTHYKGGAESTGKKQKKSEEEGEQKPKTGKKANSEETATTGYIHVRARRGQATDSHSLAERVRREKISERMKTLQLLVPGCDKVTGKALVLDEIINYVQSLQTQVEFLSMKLASLNPIFFDFRMDLDGLMIQPETSLSSMTPAMAQCNVVAPPALVDAASPTAPTPTMAAGNNFPLIDNSQNIFLLPQGVSPNAYSQSQENVRVSSWDVEEQRRKQLLISSGIGDNLCYFH